MANNRQRIIKMINMLLFILLVIVSVYISYQISKGSREGFDTDAINVKPIKITGTTTLLKGKSASNEEAPIKIVAASEENRNETEQPYKSSPASITDSTKKVIPVVTKKSLIPAPASAPAPKLQSEASDLTTKEKQLFDAFLEKRLTDDKVQELIDSGILTEKLVEKFLSMIDDLPEGPPVTRAPKKLSSITPATQKDANLLEGFCGSSGTYARANSF
jgi:hypothetical protein